MIGEPSHGHVLGMGMGLKARDMFGLSSSQDCSKHYKKDHARETKALTDCIEKLETRYTVLINKKMSSVVLEIL